MAQQFIDYISSYFQPAVFSLTGINLFLFLISVYFCKKPIKEFFGKINKKTWLLLLLIFLVGFSLRLFVSPHQFFQPCDEAEYIKSAGSLTFVSNYPFFLWGRAVRTAGWPLILAIAFKLFGTGLNTAFYFVSILGALTIINIFFVAFLLSKKEDIALYSAALFSILPLHILWSGSAETNVPGLFFLTLGSPFCLLYFHYYKNPKHCSKLLWASLLGMAFACQFRPEYYVIFLAFCAELLVLNFHQIKKLILPLTILFVLITPNMFLNLNFLASGDWRNEKGNYWDTTNLIHNSLKRGGDLFNDLYHPYILSVLYLGGFIYLFFRKRRVFLFLASWFLLFYFSYYSSWFGKISPELGSRFFLNFYPVIVISAAYAIKYLQNHLEFKNLKKIFSLFLCFIFLSILSCLVGQTNNFYNSEMFSICKAETEIVKLAEKEISQNYTVFANLPRMLAITDLNVLKLDLPPSYEEFFADYDSRRILFFRDFTCLDSPKRERIQCPPYQDFRANCERMEEYPLIPILGYKFKDFTFGFYALKN